MQPDKPQLSNLKIIDRKLSSSQQFEGLMCIHFIIANHIRLSKAIFDKPTQKMYHYSSV